MPQRYDAIVVGGGHNGLVAAWYLRHAGQSVIVLEARGVVGGPCSPLECFPGYRASYSNSPGSLDPRIVRDLDLQRFGLEFLQPPPDPPVIQPFEDARAFAAWRDPARFNAGVRAFSAHDAVALPAFPQFLDELARTLNISLFEPPPT